MSGPMRSRRGVTLVEVLMATLIVSLVVVSATWAMSAAVTAKQIRAEEPATAALLAREIHELAASLPTGASSAPPATNSAEIGALDTLDGARFAPAILATGEAAPDASDWRQEVSVSVYDVADPALPLSPHYEPVEAGSSGIYRVSVHMWHRDADMGTWWWWIRP